MGWLFGWSTKEALVKHLTDSQNYSTNGRIRVLDHALVGNNLWLLMQHQPIETKFIVLARLKHSRGAGPVGHDWGYKDMDESTHPYYYDCPERLLKQSTCDKPSSVEWRAQCRKWRAERNARLSSLKKLKPGDTFYWNGKPLKFVDPARFYLRPHQHKNYVLGEDSNGKVHGYPKKSVSATPPQSNQ